MADRNRRLTLEAFALPFLFLIVAIASPALATSYSVDTLLDTSGADNCSLRDALNAANGSPTTGSTCSTAGTGTDTIHFSVTGSIMLGSTLPAIANTLTITGPTNSPGIKIDGGRMVQLMIVYSGATLNLQFLTLTGGATSHLGGGINNDDGTLTVTNCTFSGNSAEFGGGILNDGTLTVTNSTFSGNSATGVLSGGGAIRNNATLMVTDSTFSGNSVAGSISEGGAIDNGGTLTLKGSILASSTGGNCGGEGMLADDGYNISDDGSCSFPLTGTSINNGMTLDLGALASNGGPTMTIALGSGSQAIGFDKDCTDLESTPQPLLTDQRLFTRPNSPSKCDSGAYEHDGVPPITGTFHGNLTITSGMTVIMGGTVTGNVTQRGGSLMTSGGATIGGNLQITGGGTFTIDDTTIDGDMQVQSLPASTAQDQICGSTVKDSLQVHNNGAPITIGNSSMSCAGNTIGGNLQANNNTAAVQVFDDMVTGNLQCQGNSSIMGNMDMAHSLPGQCANFYCSSTTW